MLTVNACVMMDTKQKIVPYLFAIVMVEENASIIKNVFARTVSLEIIVRRLHVQKIVIIMEFVSKESAYVNQVGEDLHVI